MSNAAEIYAAAVAPTTLWLRGDARLIDDGRSIELTRPEAYDLAAPGVGINALMALANVRTSDHTAAFVRSYGLLRSGPGTERHVEHVADFRSIARTLKFGLAIPAFRVAALDGDEEAAFALRQKVGQWKMMYPRFGADLDAGGWRVEHQADMIVAEIVSHGLPAQQLVAGTEIEQRQGSGYVRVIDDAGPRFFLAPVFNSLAGFAFHTLAQLLQKRVTVRVCGGCGEVFVPDRPNRLHHPGHGAAARQRRHRAAS